MANGVFTTLKIQEGKPLFLEKHLTRLLSHAHALTIPLPINIENYILDYLKANKIVDAALRITISADGQLTLDLRPLPPNLPVSLISLPDTRDSYKIYKTTNRKVNDEAKKNAEKHGASDAIFVQKDYIIEATAANVFSEDEKGNLITPPMKGKGLQGIARQVIIEKTSVIERDIPINTNGSLVLVNSLRIQKVTTLNGNPLRDGEKLATKLSNLLSTSEVE